MTVEEKKGFMSKKCFSNVGNCRDIVRIGLVAAEDAPIKVVLLIMVFGR
jgi:hypothetical protein